MAKQPTPGAFGGGRKQFCKVNPGHPVTEAMAEQAPALLTILLLRQGGETIISKEDLERLTEARKAGRVNLAVKEGPEGIHLWLVDGKEATRLAAGPDGGTMN